MIASLKSYTPWVLVALLVMYVWYDHRNPRLAPQKVMAMVATHPDLRNVASAPLKECVTVVAYNKASASERLDVPDSVKLDAAAQVVAAGELAPYEGTTTVTAVLNTGTGRTSLLSRREPLPFFSLMNDKEVGIRYGYTGDGRGFDLFGQLTFLRIGRIHTALYVESNSRSEAKAMLQAGYKF